jgi:hypothetical protein
LEKLYNFHNTLFGTPPQLYTIPPEGF